MSRRVNGDGTIFKRKDGRWSAQAYVTFVNGERKRICITARKREDVKTKLAETLLQEKDKIPFAEKDWTVGEYLDYWLKYAAIKDKRLNTVNGYAGICRLHLKPALGSKKLNTLGVKDVQNAIDTLRAGGAGDRTLQKVKQTLSSALTHAMREELIFRNVARLVPMPKYSRKPITPWSPEQVRRFMEVAQNHRWYIGYLFLFNYGMRRGEVIGLRWSDIDFAGNAFYVRQQILRVQGPLIACDVKTAAGQRKLPLSSFMKDVLLARAREIGIDPNECYRTNIAFNKENLIMTSKTGNAVEPSNFKRAFYILAQKAGLPKITVHTVRHTTATLLKNLRVPIRDAHIMLGHANPSTTQQIYQHGDDAVQRHAIFAVSDIVSPQRADKDGAGCGYCCQESLSNSGISSYNGDETCCYPWIAEPKVVRSNRAGCTTERTGVMDVTPVFSWGFASASVLWQARTRAITRAFGCVAVKNCCQNTEARRAVHADLERCVAVIGACDMAIKKAECPFWLRHKKLFPTTQKAPRRPPIPQRGATRHKPNRWPGAFIRHIAPHARLALNHNRN
jgi:integrase